MKLSWKQIDPFLKSPDPTARVVLVYGPDDGLMRARIKQLALHVVADLNDPFNVTVLDAGQIADDPALLVDEASAMSMMGGDRLVKIENGGNNIVPALKSYLENPSSHTLVLIEAGELSTKSALRLLCEKDKQAAALPCYVEDGRNLSSTIRSTLSADNYTASSDAIEWLSVQIAGDHGRVVSELEKLKTYMGDQSHITLEDVQAACGTGGAESIDDFIHALAGRQTKLMMRSFEKLKEEGVPMIVLLRALQTHFRKLHITKARMENGQTAQIAMKQISPPIFFKYEKPFLSQLSAWNFVSLGLALQKLSELEARCKTTGMPVETLCSQAFLSLAARRGG